jgi:hypothetical protein
MTAATRPSRRPRRSLEQGLSRPAFDRPTMHPCGRPGFTGRLRRPDAGCQQTHRSPPPAPFAARATIERSCAPPRGDARPPSRPHRGHRHRARARRGGHRARVGPRPAPLIDAVCGRPLHAAPRAPTALSGRPTARPSTRAWRCTSRRRTPTPAKTCSNCRPMAARWCCSCCWRAACRRCPALRLADPGEFTERAFLNDKLDLAQAEAVADLIDASTEAAARSAGRSLAGAFSAARSTRWPNASCACACWSRRRWTSPKRRSTS